MQTVQLEYGQGTLNVDLPDTAEIFLPGQTVADPVFLADAESATRHSIQNPLGMPPIHQLVGPGAKVTISFPDKVKGGFQDGSHRKTSIPILIEECLKSGIEKEDITLICSNGLHRKNTPTEIRRMLGDEVYDRFAPTHQIINHDSEDWDNLVDLGYDEFGDPVIMNRMVFESDLPILIGHVLGNPYGGYSGGYKMASTGITHWRSIAAHHTPAVMHRPDFTPVSPHNLMHRKFDAIGQHMEKHMGHKFFMCDAVLDTAMRQIAIFSGYGQEIQPRSWDIANQRTYIPWAKKKFDVMVFGMPQEFHYGNGHGTNPILILQAIAANIIRHRRVLNDRFVVICSSICDGYFNDEEFGSYRELYELFQTHYHNTLPELEKFGEYFCQNEDYIRRYRFRYGYHPYHAFSMISCGHIAEIEAAAVYIVGAHEPGYARAMGMKTRATFQDAFEDAKKYVGSQPHILALPRTFKTAAVHLMMENDPIPKIG
jgi:nickel-dependent lactate racemase